MTGQHARRHTASSLVVAVWRYSPKVRKAIVGGAVAGAAALGQAMLDGNLTRGEITVTGGTVIVAAAAVWGTRNRP